MTDVRNLSTGEVHSYSHDDAVRALVTSHFLATGRAMSIHDETAVQNAMDNVRYGKQTASIGGWCVIYERNESCQQDKS